MYFLDKNGILYDEDGNKRIADYTLVALTIMIAESRIEEKEMMVSIIMKYFLDKNGILYDEDGNKRIADYTLVALTIMIAESRIEEKEMMVSIIMNCI